MQFNSFSFIIFMLVLMPILALTKKRQIRHIELLIASYIFYGCWDYRFCILMLALTLLVYLAGRRIENESTRSKKLWLKLGVIGPLLVLAFFKYFNFFTDSFIQLFHIQHATVIKVLLPVGISFYTFQSISYVVDVYRKDIEGQSNFINVALYISFFPQLVAGPIVKSKDFFPQLQEERNVSLRNIEAGIQLFVLGLFKKIVIADRISVFVDEVFRTPNLFSGATVVLAVCAYSVQIYCDFSGYTDMAIGAAKCIGYDFKKNFDIPYISKNITEFWRRWHISLSTWLREYLYIPLGGNRKGRGRTYINLLITMVLGGLWHGASWTFVMWGTVQGVALCVHKAWMKRASRGDKSKVENVGRGSALKACICTVCTFIFVSLAWVLFRAQSFSQAVDVYMGMFRWESGITHIYVYAIIGLVFIIVEMIVKSRMASTEVYEKGILKLDTVWGLFVLLTFLGITLCTAYIGSNPFIYFQF